MSETKKNSAAVALGRRGGRKGGPARAAKLTPEQRSESARKAVQARWAKAREGATAVMSDSDKAVLSLLQRIKAAGDQAQINELSKQLERAIFHRQFESV